MKLFTSLSCSAVGRLLVLLIIVTCSTTAANSQNLKSKFLPPGSIIFRAFDNNIDGNGGDYLGITSLVYLEKGDKFSLTNATFITDGNSSHWEAPPRKSFSSIEFQYLGLNPLEPSTNICMYVGDNGEIQLSSLQVNGQPGGSLFSITESITGNTSNINISSIDANSLYITQGEWSEENDEYSLQGNVIDGINIGSSLTDWQNTGIPNEIGGSELAFGNTPGDYYGVLNCNGAVYVCDFADIQPIYQNWVFSVGISTTGPDPQEFCEHLCNVICDYCVYDVDIYLDNDCNLTAKEDICELPYEYRWQRLQNNEWINVSVSITQDGSIDPLNDVSSDYTYRLVVECGEYCTNYSEELTPVQCAPDPSCAAEIIPFQSSCYLSATLNSCSIPGTLNPYQWYKLVNGNYIPILGAIQSYYTASEGGTYRIEVEGCYGCPDLFWDFVIDDVEIIAAVNTMECCDYSVCIPINPGETIDNITLRDGQNLNTEPGFNFPYFYDPSTIIGSNPPNQVDLVSDLNNWLTKGQAYWQKTECSTLKGGPIAGIRIWIVGAEPDLFNEVFFNFEEKSTFRSNCYTTTDGHTLTITPPCADYTSIDWSTGDEDVTTVTYSGIASYHEVTVTCPDGCVWTSSVYIDNGNGGPTSLLSNEDINAPTDNTISLQNLQQPLSFEETKEYILFPNPTLGRFTINSTTRKVDTPILLNVISLKGEVVATFKNLIINHQSKLIDLSHLLPGVYIVHIHENNLLFTSKIVIIK